MKLQYSLNIGFTLKISDMKFQYSLNIGFILKIFYMKFQYWFNIDFTLKIFDMKFQYCRNNDNKMLKYFFPILVQHSNIGELHSKKNSEKLLKFF